MSRGDAEVVHRLFEAVARGDDDAVLSLYDPDVFWDGTRSRWAEVMPGDPVWRGHEELRRFFRNYHEMWADLQHEIDELIEVGSRVVTVIRVRGRGDASGVEVEWTGNAAVWTVRDGRVIHVVWFASREEALEAAETASGP